MNVQLTMFCPTEIQPVRPRRVGRAQIAASQRPWQASGDLANQMLNYVTRAYNVEARLAQRNSHHGLWYNNPTQWCKAIRADGRVAVG